MSDDRVTVSMSREAARELERVEDDLRRQVETRRVEVKVLEVSCHGGGKGTEQG